jgi:hypothetical protein
MYEHAGDIHDESYNVAFDIVKYALENDLDFSVYLNSDKELNDRSPDDNHNTMTMAVDCFVEARNYRVLAKLFSDFVFVSENYPDDWIATESNEKVYGPIIDCVIASGDLRIVSDFICETNFECSWNLSGEHYRKIQELVLQNYFKDGIVRSEWEKLDPNFMEEAFQYIVEEVFFAADMYDDDDYIDGEYKKYDPRIIKKAFEACGNIFTEKDFCGEWEERDNKPCFLSPYLNVIFYVENNDREAWREKVNAILAKVKETYDI